MNKRLRIILSVVLTLMTAMFALSVTVFAADTVSKAGDVNFDGELTSDDVRTILRASVGLEKLPQGSFEIADIDGDGKITASDARLCMRAVLGKETLNSITTDISVVPSNISYEPSDGEITATCNLDDSLSEGVLTLKIYDWYKFCNGDFLLRYDESVNITDVRVGYISYGVSDYNKTDSIRFACVIADISETESVDTPLLTVTFSYDDTKSFNFTLTGKACFANNEYVSFNENVASYQISNPDCVITYVPAVAASCTADGMMAHYACSHCDNLYLDSKKTITVTRNELVIPSIPHDFIKIPTLPTCSAKGYTTNVCAECNYYYISDEVSATGHKLGEFKPYFTATCTSVGENRADCENCDYYEIERTPVAPHNFTQTIYVPTCVSEGFTLYYCVECNMTYLNNFVPMLAHEDAEGDGLCDYCETEVEDTEDELPECDHICHKSGFFGFIWKIISFFQKLFGINPLCECGAAHY